MNQASNVYEEDGHQVIQCNIRDITYRKRAEEERRLLLASAQWHARRLTLLTSSRMSFSPQL